MAIKKASPYSLFSGGLFSALKQKYKTFVDVLTGGMFSKSPVDIITHTTSEYAFIPGHHVTKVKLSLWTPTGMPHSQTLKCSSIYDGERELLQTMYQESVTKFGIPTEFYRIGYLEYSPQVDRIHGENKSRHILNVWSDVMMWYKYGKEYSRLYTKMGLINNEEIDIQIPKAHFEFVTGGYYPQAGDVFKEQNSNRMFVLLNKKAGEEKQAWLQSKQYFYTFKAKIFVDSNEIIAGQFENTYLGQSLDRRDKYDISGTVEQQSENIRYEPKPTEGMQQNPFASF